MHDGGWADDLVKKLTQAAVNRRSAVGRPGWVIIEWFLRRLAAPIVGTQAPACARGDHSAVVHYLFTPLRALLDVSTVAWDGVSSAKSMR
jgi:hypothetical protein